MGAELIEMLVTSAPPLTQQLPRRLILGLKRLSLHQRLNSPLPHWLPWSEWMITESLRFLRQTAIVSASSTTLVRMCADIGDIRDPGLVWLIMLELTFQFVRGL
jgi:hypothetical protein